VTEFLFAAQAAFRRLYRDVAKKELDLFQFATCKMAQTCTCPAQIVRSEIRNPNTLRSCLDHMPYRLCSDPGSPHPALPVYSAKDIALCDFSCGAPFIDCIFHPSRHRHRPDMPALSDEISDYPMLFPKLQVFHADGDGFCTAKPATKEYGQDGAIAFPAQCVRVRSLEKCFALLGPTEPVRER